MPPTIERKKCGYCKKSFKVCGFPTYQRACRRAYENARSDALYMARMREQFHHHADDTPYLPNETPWCPFQTKLDFEFAEIALLSALNKNQMDRFLRLMHHCALGEEFTLRSDREIREKWRIAAPRLTEFCKEEITPLYKNVAKPCELWYHPLWDWTLDLLCNRHLAPHFVWDAEQLFKYDGSKFVRFIDKPWTANQWWEIQSKLPKDTKLFCFILYVNKSKLSSFGTTIGYPVIARCANLPISIQNGDGIGGGQVVGWLPVIKEKSIDSKKKSYVNWKCVDIGINYEEQCVMALIRELKGKCPCPICLIQAEQIANLHTEYPLRTQNETEHILRLSRSLQYTHERDDCLKEYGMCDIENAFWNVANSNPHHTLSFDHLHAYHLGLFGDHLWPELQILVEKIGPHAKSLVDDWVSAILSDGQKFEDLSKVVIFVTHEFIDRYQQSHQELLNFERLLQAYISYPQDEDSPKNWNFIKAHSHHHTFDDITAKGSNKKNIAGQILGLDHTVMVAKLMCDELDYLENYNPNEELDEENETTLKEPSK
ncbi:hypothetical protein ABKN59_009698 [Abortiporus biennis]